MPKKKRGSRGKKRPSLRDLPRQMPTAAEMAELVASMDNMDARAAALIMGSIIDNLLEYAILLNFVTLSETQFNALFRNPTSPLSSFSAKIAVAHALGVYGNESRRQLDKLREIRNAFAHTIHPIDFDNPLIAEECLNLDPSTLTDHQYQPITGTPRERYTTAGTMLATHLINYNHFKYSGRTFGAVPAPIPFPDKFVLRHPPNSENPD